MSTGQHNHIYIKQSTRECHHFTLWRNYQINDVKANAECDSSVVALAEVARFLFPMKGTWPCSCNCPSPGKVLYNNDGMVTGRSAGRDLTSAYIVIVKHRGSKRPGNVKCERQLDRYPRKQPKDNILNFTFVVHNLTFGSQNVRHYSSLSMLHFFQLNNLTLKNTFLSSLTTQTDKAVLMVSFRSIFHYHQIQ